MEKLLWLLLDWLLTAVLFFIITVVVKMFIDIEKKKGLLGDMPFYPGGLPLIGHAHLAVKYSYSSAVDEMISTYNETKKCLYIWVGTKVCGYTANPPDIENILNRKDALNKGSLFSLFQTHSVGLLSNTTPRWFQMRKLANIPLAHKYMIHSFVSTFQEQSRILLQVLKEVEGETFDIYPFLSRCCQDITYGSHFGVKLGIQHNRQLSAQETVSTAISLVNKRMLRIWLFPDFIYFRTEDGKLMKKCVEHNKYIAQKIMKERRKILSDHTAVQEQIGIGDKNIKKLLDVYLDPNSGLTDEEIENEIMDLMLAGFETMSLTQSWMLLLLAMFPEHQEKVQRELDLILGNTEDISLELLQECQYLEMVAKEALRLFGLPIIIRSLQNKVQIENNSILPAKTDMVIGMFMVHRDSQYWEHPNSFYPDHFLPENEAKRPKYAFIPFGGGPRKCPAYAYGLVVVKFIVATLLRKYKFTTNQKFDNLPLDLLFMYKPSDGFLVKYEPR